MIRTLLVLPDGRQLFSGAEGAAVASATLTRTVNPQQELTLGAVCPAMLECKLLDAADVSVAPGDALTLYHVDETETLHRQGIFLVQELTRSGAGMLDMVAYDPLILLDRDMTEFVNTLTDWPYTLQQLAQLVCKECGLALADGAIPGGSFPVQLFAVNGITGRQLLSWIAEAAGCFCTANADGQAQFGWYTAVPVAVGEAQGQVTACLEGDSLRITDETAAVDGTSVTSACWQPQGEDMHITTVQRYCLQGGLQLQDYTVQPVEKVQLRQSPEDVGTIYPDTVLENTYCVTGNPLLTANDARTLEGVAKRLYTRLQPVSYTPCRLKLQATADIRPGQILQVRRGAQVYTCYVMTTVQTAACLEAECTGSAQRGGTGVTNNQSYRALSGKVLNLQLDVDGLRLQNQDADGRLSQLELDLEGVRTMVSGQTQTQQTLEERLTTLQQTAEDVSIHIRQIRQDGASKVVTDAGYTFSDDGLVISKTGQQMENRLDCNGMYVTRSGETMLRADARGVLATDVTVRNYLVIGQHSRIEDYAAGTDKKRTACFWIGGD